MKHSIARIGFLKVSIAALLVATAWPRLTLAAGQITRAPVIVDLGTFQKYRACICRWHCRSGKRVACRG